MTKQEAIRQLKIDFKNKIIADDGFNDELDIEIAEAMNWKDLLEEYQNK